jgi:hypothetical protein
MTDFYSRQIQYQVSNLLMRANDTGILCTLLDIRMKQLQYSEWITHNPLDMWHYSNPNVFKQNFTAQILCAMNQLGISFKYNELLNPSPVSHISLFDIFKDNYRKIKDSLKKRNVVYLNQFLLDNDTLLTKDHMNNFPLFQQQGCTPSWWFELENTVLEDKNNRTLYPQFRPNLSQHEAHCNINQPILPTTKIDGRRNN